MSAVPLTALSEQITYLKSIVSERANHSRSTLLSHLIGTCQLLASWGCRKEVCLAGLFHSIYGTEAYRFDSVDVFKSRNQVRAAIGPQAEHLVFLFCAMTRDSFWAALAADLGGCRSLRMREGGSPLSVDDPTFRDLCHLVLANWLEQKGRLPERRSYDIDDNIRLLHEAVDRVAAEAIEREFTQLDLTTRTERP